MGPLPQALGDRSGHPGWGPHADDLPASCAVATDAWAGNLGVSLLAPPSSGWVCRADPGTLAVLPRDSFFRMRPPGADSFRLKGPRPAGSPLVLTFGFSWVTLWAAVAASSPCPLPLLQRTLS